MYTKENPAGLEYISKIYSIIGKKPYDYQIRAWQAIESLKESGGTVLIEAPTASGKTEAVVIPFLSQCVDEAREQEFTRLIYILPNSSLVHKMKERITDLAVKICGEKWKNLVSIEEGLNPTHMFLYRINIATWDSFLYGLAAHRTLSKRFTFPAGAIAQSIVVFDEIQMYQDNQYYTPRLIGLIYNILVETGIPIVYMTATLPDELENIIGINRGNNTHKNLIRVKPLPDDNNKPVRGSIIDYAVVTYNDEDDAINKIIEIIQEYNVKNDSNEKILVIRNTVKNAVKTYKKIKKHYKNTILIHSRFKRKDREAIEKDLEKHNIIVSTQVIEAGLDIAGVSMIITDIAPLDALIQRIGRAARRPHEKAQAIILVPEKNNNVYPYDNIPVERTKNIIEETGLKEINNLLKDLDTAKQALNQVYTNYISTKDLPQTYYETYFYFENLKLFSAPPELRIMARPELYINLLCHNPNLDIENIIKTNKQLQISREELLENIIKISVPGALRPKSNLYKRIESVLYTIEKDKAKLFIAIDFSGHKIMLREANRINPYETYLLKKEVYDNETGLSFNNYEGDDPQ